VTDRKTALLILEALRRSPVGDAGVLVGSSGHPTFSDAGAEGYAPMRHQVEAGFERLRALLDGLDA